MKLKNQEIIVELSREGKNYTQKMTTDQLRMYVLKESVSGIGTITATNESGEFVGISHSIKMANRAINVKFLKRHMFKK